MDILKKQKPIISYKYIYLAAFLLSLIVNFQFLILKREGQTEMDARHVILFGLNYFVWALLIDWVYGLSKGFDFSRRLYFKQLIKIILNGILLILLHIVIFNIIYYSYLFTLSDITFEAAFDSFTEVAPRIFMVRFLDLAVILLILKVLDTFKLSQNRKIQVVELENQLHISQLSSLKAQLNPHFLFNALHALHTLIGHNDVKAKSMVIKISNLLRKILDQRDRHTITLREELDYLRDYLEIEQERFHDRLSINLDIDKETEDIMVPSLLLQPLAENAFKHGISLLEGKGTISLSSKIIDTKLVIEMNNTIPIEDHSSEIDSTKLGLNNLKNRLQSLYGENQSLNTEKNDNIFKVTIVFKSILK